MRRTILIVDQALEFGGSIVSTANLIRGLDPAKFNIIFVSSTNEQLIRSKLRERGEQTPVVIIRKAIHYNNLRYLWPRTRASRFKGLRKLGLLLVIASRLVANLPYMLKLALLIKRHKVELVQLNNGIDDEVAMVCRLLKVPQVAYIRGHTPLSRPQRRFFLPQITLFFSVSEYVRQTAIADGIDPQTVVVATPPAIPEAVDPNALSRLRQRYGLKEGQAAVGIFGRIVGWKGQKEFVEAAALVARDSNAQFFIVGDNTDGETDYYQELLQTIQKHGLKDRIIMTGYIENVYDYYALMDVVVHCSILPEPSGRVIFEAMSQGKPVVASIHGGPPEFIDDGVDGLLANPRDAHLLAQRILSLLRDSQFASQIGAKAKSKIDSNYNKQLYAKRIEALYEHIMDSEASTESSNAQAEPRLSRQQPRE